MWSEAIVIDIEVAFRVDPLVVFFFQAEDGIRDLVRSRGSEMCIRDRYMFQCLQIVYRLYHIPSLCQYRVYVILLLHELRLSLIHI